MPSKTISIVGAGLVGTSCLCHILEGVHNANWKDYANQLQINLFEQKKSFGPGLAYSSTSSTSLANTPVGLMSIYPDKMGDFMDWLSCHEVYLKKHSLSLSLLHANSYVPRQLFGLYLEEKVRQASLLAEKLKINLNLIGKVVSNINADSKDEVVMTADGMSYPSDKVVLCVGNQPTESFRYLLGTKGYISTPYPEDKMLEDVNGSKNILIIGSGLTSVDTILALESFGYAGQITVGSRSGVFPAVRSYFKKTKSDILNADAIINQVRDLRVSPIEAINLNLKRALEDIYGQNSPDILSQKQTENGLYRLQKDLVAAISGHAHWQQLVMPLVESIEAGWSIMSTAEKQNFLEKYFRPILRYIAALPIKNAKKLLKIMQERRLAILGGVSSVTHDTINEGFIAKFSNDSQYRFDRVINATGIGKNLLQSEWPLVKNMQASGLYNFNDFGCFKVVRTNFKVMCKKRTQAVVYAPANGSYGEFIITNFIENCIKHAKIVSEDILKTL